MKPTSHHAIDNVLRFVAAIILFVTTTFTTCNPYGYKYNSGSLPEIPVNLEAFNTEYDDYNATAPTLGHLIPFCFSTNRKSNGNDFDVIYQPMNVNFDKTTGELKVTNQYDNWGTLADDYGILANGVETINTPGDEFGPCLLPHYVDSTNSFDFVLMYASDLAGDFEIRYTYSTSRYPFAESRPVAFLNSEFNDLYPSFDADFTHLYFCSDREDGVFNIFQVAIGDDEQEIVQVLSDTTSHVITRDTILSGAFDDKCPFIFGNTIVFTSNRPGGMGGFDLYYSEFEGGQWSSPVNFGPKINTEFDEYRPILIDEGVDYERSMMVFSSNRTGGLGGFDLYFAGVRKLP
jgi:hypothetical protein